MTGHSAPEKTVVVLVTNRSGRPHYEIHVEENEVRAGRRKQFSSERETKETVIKRARDEGKGHKINQKQS